MRVTILYQCCGRTARWVRRLAFNMMNSNNFTSLYIFLDFNCVKVCNNQYDCVSLFGVFKTFEEDNWGLWGVTWSKNATPNKKNTTPNSSIYTRITGCVWNRRIKRNKGLVTCFFSTIHVFESIVVGTVHWQNIINLAHNEVIIISLHAFMGQRF